MSVRVRYRPIGDYRTRYFEAGEGPAVLLVHGAGASADTWARNVAPLSARCRVIAHDLLGHGFSDYVPRNGRAPQTLQAEHVIRLLDALGLASATLVGSSFGGLVAALVALGHRDRVDRLVIVGSASVFHPAKAQGDTLEGVRRNQSHVYADPTLDALRARNVGSNYAKDDPMEEILLVQASFLAVAQHAQGFADTLDGLIETAADSGSRVQPRLEELVVPTLVIQGREDPRVKLAHVEDGVRRLPAAALEVFDRCGHKPYAEHSERFNARVLSFVSDVRRIDAT